MSPEFALVAAVETVPVLQGKISAMQPKKDAAAPFAFYIPNRDEEAETLAGLSGLQVWGGQLHIVAGSMRHLLLLCALVKEAVNAMPGRVYTTPRTDAEPGLKGRILVETVSIRQSSPDLYEAEVGLYRRIMEIQMDYQTEEVVEEDGL